MTWAQHAIWWHVYPLGALGAPIRSEHDRVHRLPRLQRWIPHLISLGCNGLQLGPIFASQTHGYDTLDYFRIDPRLGDDADFDALIAAAKQAGVRVMLDGVFNHVGDRYPAYLQALEHDNELFRIDRSDAAHPRPAVFEGHGSLVELDHTSAATVELVQQVMLYWLRRGIDAWRLDAAYAVDPVFWARVLPRVRQEFPDAIFVGEVIHGDYVDIVERSTLDSVTQYELWKAIWSSLRDKNFFEMSWNLKRNNEFDAHFLPMTFIGNHDVTRIASQVGQPAAVLALVVLCTVPGMPSLYYGDEFAWAGVKQERIGGGDEVRQPLPESAAAQDNWMTQVYRQLIGVRRRHPWLATARTRDVELTNERYVYEAYDDTHQLRVTLDLAGAPTARIEGGEIESGGIEFAYGAV